MGNSSRILSNNAMMVVAQLLSTWDIFSFSLIWLGRISSFLARKWFIHTCRICLWSTHLFLSCTRLNLGVYLGTFLLSETRIMSRSDLKLPRTYGVWEILQGEDFKRIRSVKVLESIVFIDFFFLYFGFLEILAECFRSITLHAGSICRGKMN